MSKKDIKVPNIGEFKDVEVIEVLIKKDIAHIAIPWGAAHMPALEQDLIAIGFKKSNEGKWLRSIAVKDYLENKEEFERGIEYHGFPYILNVETQGNHVTTSALFSIVKSVSTNEYERFSLAWGDLFESIRFTDGNYTSLLPKIAGKPILFDLAEKNGQQRFRFLWFFQLGELEN